MKNLVIFGLMSFMFISCQDNDNEVLRKNITGKVMVRAFQENLGTEGNPKMGESFIQVTLATFNTSERISDVRMRLRLWFDASKEERSWVSATLDQNRFTLSSSDEYDGESDPKKHNVVRYYYRAKMENIIGHPAPRDMTQFKHESYELKNINLIRQYGVSVEFKINGVWYTVPYTENTINHRPDYPFSAFMNPNMNL